MKTEEILKKIEELEKWYLRDFIKSLDLTPEQMELLANHENEWVRMGLAKNPNLTNEKVMIKLSSDEGWNVKWWLAKNPNLTKELMIKLGSDEDRDVRYGLADNPNLTEELMIELASYWNWDVRHEAFKKLEKLNTLKSEDLESAYDLINNSKYIGRENFEKTFDFIINKFPELSKLAEMFKRIILKGKRDLK